MLITSEKHYNTLNNYYMSKYGKKVFKVSLNAGFSCPNIDGTVGRGGCSFVQLWVVASLPEINATL